MRRLLIILLFGLVLAGGAAVTWQAMGKARLVEEDLTTARTLLARAGGFESGQLKQRLRLIKQAEQHTLRTQRRLGQWPCASRSRPAARFRCLGTTDSPFASRRHGASPSP